MAAADPVCGVCDLRKITKNSVVWCSECDEGLCLDCKEHHSSSRLSKHHATISIAYYKTLPSFILNIRQFCEKHDEKYQTFCKKHDCPCCRKCVIESHSNCNDITVLEDVIQNIKTSVSFQDIQEQITDVSNNIRKIHQDRKSNAISITEQKRAIGREIQEVREKMNEHLDTLQEKLIKELEEAEVRTNTQIQKIVVLLKDKEAEIKEIEVNIDNIKKYASDLQAFFGIKQFERTLQQNEKFITSLVDDGHLEQATLSFKSNELIEKNLNALSNIGEVDVEVGPCKTTLTSDKHKQAQIMVPGPQCKSVNNVALISKRNIASSCGENIRGCHLLPNGKTVITSGHTNKLAVLTPEGQEEFTIDMKSERSCDVTCIEPDILAVSLGSAAKHITIVDLEKRTVMRTIDAGYFVYGVTYKDGKLICSAFRRRVFSIDLKDGSIKSIVDMSFKGWPYVVANGNYIYYTNYDTNTVTCCDMNGKTKWSFHDKSILTPSGIAVDNLGYVYVVGEKSHNVSVISPDGKQHRELLTTEDGIHIPQVLYFDKKSNQLLVAEFKSLALYTISHT